MSEAEKTLDEISASMTRYYDALTDEEKAEDRAWGDFAAAQLAGSEAWDDWQDEPDVGLAEAPAKFSGW